MARYAISEKGAESLKNLGKSILTTCNDIMATSKKLETIVVGLDDGLGIYSGYILELVKKNQSMLLENKSDFEGLAQRLNSQGDEILSLLGFDTGGGTTQSGAANMSQNKGTSSNSSSAKDSYGTFLASNGYARNVGFGNLDERTAKDMAMAIAETKELFPGLDLQFVGSLQARNDGIRESLTNMYMDAYKKHYPSASENDLLPVVQQQVEEDMMGFIPQDGTIAQSLFVGSPAGAQEWLYSNFNGITINEAYGSDYDHFVQVKQDDVNAGWKPQNCNTPKATVDHELGHQIAKLVDAHNDPDIQELYNRFVALDSNKQSSVLSGYAATNIHEFIAESWSEYRNNPNCRDCAKFVSERMLDLYNSNPNVKRKTLRR